MVSDQNQVTGNRGTIEVQLCQASHQGDVGLFLGGLGELGGHGEDEEHNSIVVPRWRCVVSGRLSCGGKIELIYTYMTIKL